MALFMRNATCVPVTPLLQIKRFRGKINIQKPKPPHFDKAKYLAFTKPWFLSWKKGKHPVEMCTKSNIPPYKLNQDRNFLQEIIAKELNERFVRSKLIIFCHINPMPAETRFDAYALFTKANMHFHQYGRETMKMAVTDTPYETVLDIYHSQNMTIFSPEPQIKKALSILKKFPQLVLLAGIYENRLVSKDELIHYSKIPDIQAAQSDLVHTLNIAASQLVSNLTSHQTTLVSHLDQRSKQLEEK